MIDLRVGDFDVLLSPGSEELNFFLMIDDDVCSGG